MDANKRPANAGAKETFKLLCVSHKGKLRPCTCIMNEIKTLMETEGNVKKVNEFVALFEKSHEDFKGVHDSVRELLSEEEKEKEIVCWYKPRILTFVDFHTDMEK